MKIILIILAAFFLTGCEWGWEYDRDTSPLPSPTAVPTPFPTPEPANTLPLELEVEELRSVVKTLAEENRRLKELLAISQENTTLSASTFSVSTGSTTPAPQPAPEVSTPAPPPEDQNPATILYVNPNWHYLVIDQGSEDGFSQEDRIDIFRQGSLIATAVVTDVKPGQSVAEVNLDSVGSTGVYPRKTDTVRIK